MKRLINAAVGGGVASGTLDLLYASLAYPLPFRRILQSIGSGWLGAAAYRQGDVAATLGLASHYAILITAAGLYAAAAERWSALATRPLSGGMVYGAAIYGVMNYFVAPLSRATTPPPGDVISQLPHLFAHMLLVGVPIAWVARRQVNRDTGLAMREPGGVRPTATCLQ